MNNFLDKESNLHEDSLIGYLNGLLAMLETFNDGPYTGNTFEFSKIANLHNDPVISISTALGGHWQIEINQLEDLYQDIDKTVNEYCQQYAVKGSVSGVLKLLLKENFVAYAVTVKGPGWYEASYKDYFFDCKGTYYFLHFGISD